MIKPGLEFKVATGTFTVLRFQKVKTDIIVVCSYKSDVSPEYDKSETTMSEKQVLRYIDSPVNVAPDSKEQQKTK